MTDELGRSVVVVRTEARKTSADGDDTSGLGGAGKVKEKLWQVDGGCNVDAMTSTSRVNDSYWNGGVNGSQGINREIIECGAKLTLSALERILPTSCLLR